MNKSIIALAIAAALPVAAQADATLSGSVTTKYSNSGVIDTDAALSIASSEVLANGMTATASFTILGGSTNSGTATLAGDFGTLTVGNIDADGAFQAGDSGSVVANTTEGASTTASTVNGIHYAGELAGLAVAAQANASTGAAGGAATETKSTQVSATYDFNGLTVGYAYASAVADDAAIAGVTAAQTAFGAAYSFGDLSVTAGKSSVANEAALAATYTTTLDAIGFTATMSKSGAGVNSHKLVATYSLDGVALTATSEKGKQMAVSASYTSGDLTVTASRLNNGSTDASAALAMGNATLTAARDGSADATSLTYKVSF